MSTSSRAMSIGLGEPLLAGESRSSGLRRLGEDSLLLCCAQRLYVRGTRTMMMKMCFYVSACVFVVPCNCTEVARKGNPSGGRHHAKAWSAPADTQRISPSLEEVAAPVAWSAGNRFSGRRVAWVLFHRPSGQPCRLLEGVVTVTWSHGSPTTVEPVGCWQP